jgi:hypothetical protein
VNTSETTSYGTGKPQSSKTETKGVGFWIQSDAATSLCTGGKANDFKVKALVYQAGKFLADNKPCLIRADFDQRDFESGARGIAAIAIRKP